MSRLSRSEYFAAWSELHGGVDPHHSVWLRGYLSTLYPVMTVLAQLRMSPNAMTVLGGITMNVLIVWQASTWSMLLALLMLLALFVDALDGALAIATKKSSHFGAVLDTVMDRANEIVLVAVLAAALSRTHIYLALIAVSVTLLLEYVRTKATSLTSAASGFVTVWERPTRVLISMSAIVVAVVLPSVDNATAALGGLLLWLVLGVVGIAQLLVRIKHSSADFDLA